MTNVRASRSWSRRLAILSLLAGVSSSAAGCLHPATTTTQSTVLSQANSTKVELYFGRRADGRLITDEEFKAFEQTVVRPLLPGGYTLMQAHGYWTGADGKSSDEETTILMVAFPRETAAATVDASVDPIRRAYCSQFAQESVLRLDTATQLSFFLPPAAGK